MKDKPAVVLLSGGLDSTTVLAIAKGEGFEPYALSFRYGQRHETELDSARRIVAVNAVAEHVVAEIDLRVFGGSALTADIEVPKSRSDADMGGGIPITYVPARNTVFLAFALAWAEVLGSSDVFIGSTRSTKAATPPAGRSTSRLSSGWRTWQRRLEWRDRRGSRSTHR